MSGPKVTVGCLLRNLPNSGGSSLAVSAKPTGPRYSEMVHVEHHLAFLHRQHAGFPTRQSPPALVATLSTPQGP